MRSLRHSAALAALGALTFSAAATADTVPAGSRTLSAGDLTATLTWQAGDEAGVDPHLQIARAGTTVLDSDLSKECQLCGSVGEPTNSALHLVDLDGDGQSEVLVDLYTGGAHCCATTLIWYLEDPATNSSARRVLSLGDQAYRLEDRDGDGNQEIVTADDRFAYEFAAFAFDWFPPLVYDWKGQTLVDVTRDHPDLITTDLSRIRKALPGLRRHYDPRGAVAGYVADLYLLGRGDEVAAYLRSALRHGDLQAFPKGDTSWPSGRRFAPALLKFLKLNGYR
jgi:hypothetical protein